MRSSKPFHRFHGDSSTFLTTYYTQLQSCSTPILPGLSDHNLSPGLACLHQPHLWPLCAHPGCDQTVDCALSKFGSHHNGYPNQEACSAKPAVNAFQDLPQLWSAGRALCIGINYFNQKGAMRGRTDEARSMCEYLQQVKHYAAASVILLTDDQTGLFGQPTKRNILHALTWLGAHTFEGEKIVIYYSGHGQLPVVGQGNTPDAPSMQHEIGSMCPVDFRSSADGVIKSTEFDELLVPMKRKGARLTIILDTQVGIADSKNAPSLSRK